MKEYAVTRSELKPGTTYAEKPPGDGWELFSSTPTWWEHSGYTYIMWTWHREVPSNYTVPAGGLFEVRRADGAVILCDVTWLELTARFWVCGLLPSDVPAGGDGRSIACGRTVHRMTK